ncbi:hypothetical protein EGI22_08605 [Lacihabitans sp. LS3-19]|nr:hypothetical protein [Lacihabitans sp. LS3-19]
MVFISLAESIFRDIDNEKFPTNRICITKNQIEIIFYYKNKNLNYLRFDFVIITLKIKINRIGNPFLYSFEMSYRTCQRAEFFLFVK